MNLSRIRKWNLQTLDFGTRFLEKKESMKYNKTTEKTVFHGGKDKCQMKQAEENILDLIELLGKWFRSEITLSEIDSYFDQELIWTGFCCDQFQNLIFKKSNEKERTEKFPFVVLKSDWQFRKFSSDVFFISGELLIEKEEMQKGKLNLTAIARKKSGKMKVILVYLSNPCFFDRQNASCFKKAQAYQEATEYRNQKEQELLEERYRIILEQSSDTIFEWDIQQDTLLFSSNWSKIFGAEPIRQGVSKRLSLSANIHPEDLKIFQDLMVRAKQGETDLETEFRLRKKEGGFQWYKMQATTQMDECGKAIRTIGILTNIHEEKIKFQKLIEKAEKDPLTELYNNRAAKSQIETELNENGQEFRHAFLIIDLDNFKQINDTQGHLYGDAVLTEFSKEVRKIFRNTDIVSRIGGDEFLVFLKEIPNQSVVLHKAEEIKEIFQKGIFGKYGQYHVSVSIGISLYPKDGTSYSELYEKADRALYFAKDKGKDCFAFYDDDVYYQKFENQEQRKPVLKNVSSRQKIQKEVSQNQELMKQIFCLLFQTKDMEEAIQRTLEITGRYFDVSRVYLMENTKEKLLHNSIFEWCHQGISSEIASLECFNKNRNLENYRKLFDKDGIFYCKNIEELPEEFYCLFHNQKIVSVLQCLIQDQGAAIGVVGFDECRHNRFWTKEQIDILILISNMISTFLIKRKLELQLKQNKERLSSILNSQQSYYQVHHENYDEFYELNLAQNDYRMIYPIENKYKTFSEQGIFSEQIHIISETMIHPEDKKKFQSFFDRKQIQNSFEEGEKYIVIEVRKREKEGEYRWFSLSLFPVNQKKEIFFCFVLDLSEKKQKDFIKEQNKLLKKQLDQERYRIIVEQTGSIISEWEMGVKNQKHNPKMAETFEGIYDNRELVEIWEEDKVIDDRDLEQFLDFRQGMKQKKPYVEMTVRFQHRQKGSIWCKVASTCIFDEKGKAKSYIITVNDVDEATKSIEALKYRAEFDPLTDLPNMTAFYSKAEKLIQENLNKKYVVIRMDINRFKFINDIYGMEEGDRLLCFIADIIRHHIPETEAYGRIGGDVFCICMEFEKKQELIELMDQISLELNAYNLGYKVVPAFGLCVIEDIKVPVSILCDWAGLAIKTIKGNMIRKWAFYDDKLRAKQLEEGRIEDEMEEALESHQFQIYYQPKYEISHSQIVGAEALVRWIHPKEGMRSPDSFIPLFEKNGFIMKLDEYVWEETFRFMKKWRESGGAEFPISVNVSRHHIYNMGFCEKIIALADKYLLPHRLIELELTESLFIENPEDLYKTMGILQNKGFRFSMDDFGAGYSSLNMLKNTPVNTIKLDRGFLNETVSTEKGKIVVQCAIEMARKLNLDVIAEGVETKEQAEFLLKCGCETAQGFYYSKPLPVDQFVLLMNQKNSIESFYEKKN